MFDDRICSYESFNMQQQTTLGVSRKVHEAGIVLTIRCLDYGVKLVLTNWQWAALVRALDDMNDACADDAEPLDIELLVERCTFIEQIFTAKPIQQQRS